MVVNIKLTLQLCQGVFCLHPVTNMDGCFFCAVMNWAMLVGLLLMKNNFNMKVSQNVCISLRKHLSFLGFGSFGSALKDEQRSKAKIQQDA